MPVTPPSSRSSGYTTYRKTAVKTVSNSVAETDLLNGEITVAAGALTSTGIMRLAAWGTAKQNSGSDRVNPRIRFKFGATTLGDTGVAGSNVWGNNASTLDWFATAFILNAGATNAQVGHFFMRLDMTSATAGTGYAPAAGSGSVIVPATLGGYSNLNVGLATSAAIDTTAAVAVALTVVLPVADANVTMALTGAVVEII